MSPLLAETTCPGCGTRLQRTATDDLGCMVCLLNVALTSQPEEAAAPDRFGSYAISHLPDGSLRELGRGATGVTFHAIDTALQRPVALKIINTELAERSDEARERFIREARVAASIRHPNVAAVYQFGIREETGQGFCAMEFVEGETLEARVRRTGPLDVATTLSIARQVAAALGAAEERGLVHRDLKPANLMINAEGTVKVIDFGVAKALAETPDGRLLTQGGFVGTPAFASPEQFTGAPVDVRSDIYSLGATLWYLLTGHLPFGDRADGSAPPIAQLKAAHVPPPFVSILSAMLASEPAARPSVHDLAARLEALHGRRNRAVMLALAALVITAAGIALYFHSSRVSASAEKSIAVLPFENASGEATNSYFASGIHDDLLVNLSKIRDLKVISRDSVLPYKGSSRNLREIGKALGVNAVLEGSVRRAGPRARINVQLIDTQNGEQIWAENYDRELADAFGVQGDLAFQIASALKAKLTPGEAARLRRLPTQNGEAYLLYVQANDYFNGQEKLRPDLEKAEQLYERAIQLDPTFAIADAQLGRLEGVFYSYHERTSARRAKAEAAAREALRLQPDLPEAHVALAEIYWRTASVTNSYDYTAALGEFEIARRGLPNDPDIYGALGRIRRHQGKWKEALADLEKAASLDPNTADRWHRVFWTYQACRNYPAAAAALDRAIALSPNSWYFELNRAFLQVFWKGDVTALARLRAPAADSPENSHLEDRCDVAIFLRQFDRAETLLKNDPRAVIPSNAEGSVPKSFRLGNLYWEKHDDAPARAAFTAALPALQAQAQKQTLDDPSGHLLLARAYAGAGRTEDARREIERAIAIVPESKAPWDGIEVLQDAAYIYLMAGENDRSLSLIARLLASPVGMKIWQLRLDPAWDRLRDDPRFQKLIAQLERVL